MQKDIANRLEVSPSTVNRYLKKHRYQSVPINGKHVYTKDVFEQIVADFLVSRGWSGDHERKKEVYDLPDSQSDNLLEEKNQVIELLSKQLEIKDKQIEQLQQIIVSLNKALDQQQQLSLADKQYLLDNQSKVAEKEQKKGLFTRIFSR